MTMSDFWPEQRETCDAYLLVGLTLLWPASSSPLSTTRLGQEEDRRASTDCLSPTTSSPSLILWMESWISASWQISDSKHKCHEYWRLYDFIWDDLGGMKYMHYFTRYWSADEVYHGKPIHLNKLLFLLADELTTINNSRMGLKSSIASYQYICSRKVLYNEPWPGMNTMINLVVRVSVTIFHFLLIKPPINSVKILKIAASHIWLKILDITFSLQILFDLLYRVIGAGEYWD